MPTSNNSNRTLDAVQQTIAASAQQTDAGLVQLAQSASPAIGSVASLSGQATILRASGETVQAEVGTPVYQDDTFETAADSGVGLEFEDGSSFSLGPDARLTIDNYVYDAGGADSNMVMNLAQGAFSFVSGQVAKSGENNMTIVTPTATIGIRGTAGAGDDDEVVLLQEQGQPPGELTVTTQGGTVSLTTPNSYTNTANPLAPPSAPVPRSLSDIQSQFGGALRQLPVQLPANQNLPSGNTGGDTGTGGQESGDGQSGEADAGQPDEDGDTGDGAESEGGEGEEAAAEEGEEGEGEEGEGDDAGEGEEDGADVGDEGEDGDGETGDGDDGAGGEDDQGADAGNDGQPATAATPGGEDGGDQEGGDPTASQDNVLNRSGFENPQAKQFKQAAGEGGPGPGTRQPSLPPPSDDDDDDDPLPGDGGGLGGGEGEVNVIFVDTDNTTVSVTAAADQIQISGANISTVVSGILSGDSIIDVTNSAGQLVEISDVTSHSFFVQGIEDVRFGSLSGSDVQSISVGGTTPIAFNTFSGPLNATINGNGENNTIRVGVGINTDSSLTVDLGGGNDTVDVNAFVQVDLALTNVENVTNSLGGNQDVFLLNGANGLSVDLGAGTDDRLFLSDSNNTLSVANVETLSGGTGNDQIIMDSALAGSDDFDGGSGIDQLTLQSGSTNTAQLFSFEFVLGVAGTAETLTLNNTQLGVSFDFGHLGDGDTLTLQTGNNVVTVTDIDTINTGAGNDTISVNNASSFVTIDTGAGTDSVLNASNTATFLNLSNVNNYVGGNSASDQVALSTQLQSGDVFSGGGTSDNDFLTLAAGGTNTGTIALFETINGTVGNDDLTLEGATGLSNVTINFFGGTDTLNLSNDGFSLTLNSVEFFNGGTGNETITLASALLSGAQYDGGIGGTDVITLLAGSTNTATLGNFEFIKGVAGSTESLTLETVVTTSPIIDLGDFLDNDTLDLADGGNDVTVRDLKNFIGGGGDDIVTLLSALGVGSSYDGDGSGDDTDTLILLDDTANSAIINDFEQIQGNSSSGIDLTFLSGSQINTDFNFTGAGFDVLFFNDAGSFATLTGIEEVHGGAGNDTVTVLDTTGVNFELGDGGDVATGGVGASDLFIYSAISDANVGEGERITNFESGTDIIDISVLEQGILSYIGSANFSESGSTEIRFVDGTETLEIDIDGDAVADMEIIMNGITANDLSEFDFGGSIPVN